MADIYVTSYRIEQHLWSYSMQTTHHYCQPFCGDFHGVVSNSPSPYTKIYLFVCFLSVCLSLHLSVPCSLQCSRASSGCKHSVCHCIVCHFIKCRILSHATMHHFCLLCILIMEINISVKYVCSFRPSAWCVAVHHKFSVWISVFNNTIEVCSLDGVMGELLSWSGAALLAHSSCFSAVYKNISSLCPHTLFFIFLHPFFHSLLRLFVRISLSLLLPLFLHLALPLSILVFPSFHR